MSSTRRHGSGCRHDLYNCACLSCTGGSKKSVQWNPKSFNKNSTKCLNTIQFIKKRRWNFTQKLLKPHSLAYIRDHLAPPAIVLLDFWQAFHLKEARATLHPETRNWFATNSWLFSLVSKMFEVLSAFSRVQSRLRAHCSQDFTTSHGALWLRSRI